MQHVLSDFIFSSRFNRHTISQMYMKHLMFLKTQHPITMKMPKLNVLNDYIYRQTIQVINLKANT